MKEISIEIRSNGISIQGAGIGNNPEQAKKILEDALNAMNQKPKSTHTNEIILPK